MASSSCGPDIYDPNRTFEFFAGEDRVLNIHLEEVNTATGIRQSFDLSSYDANAGGTPPGSIKLKIPGIATLQTASVMGNPVDGNITFEFTAQLTSAAQGGTIDGVLTQRLTGKVRKFRALQKIELVG